MQAHHYYYMLCFQINYIHITLNRHTLAIIGQPTSDLKEVDLHI